MDIRVAWKGKGSWRVCLVTRTTKILLGEVDITVDGKFSVRPEARKDDQAIKKSQDTLKKAARTLAEHEIGSIAIYPQVGIIIAGEKT